MLRRYREVLSEPHVARLLFTALLGRMPQGMGGLAILLLLTPSVGYGKAGIASGLSVATAGIANIGLARAIDVFGVRTILLPAATVYAGFTVALAALAHRDYLAALGLCGVLGLASAPISSVSRGMWPGLLGEERAQVLVRVVGELDLVTAPVLDRHLAGAASRERPRVVVDLSGVTFLDVRGINSLVTAQAAAHQVGSNLVLRGAGPQVHRLLEVCGLEGHFTVEGH